MISSKLMVGLVSVSLAASTSIASTKKSAQAEKAKTAASAAKAQPATELPPAKEETVESAPGSAASATSSAQISTATSGVAPKKWGLLIDSWTESKVDATNLARSDSSIDQTVNHSMLIRPSYKLNDTTSAALGVEFSHDFIGQNANGRTGAMADIYGMIARSNIAMIGPVKTKGYLRAYLPTSIASQDPVTGRHLMLRGQTNFEYPVSKAVSVSYNLEPRYFFQKNRASLVFDNDRNINVTRPNEHIRLTHWLGVEATMGKFGFYQNVGLRSRWYHEYQARIDGPNVIPNQRDYLYLESGLSYAVLEQLTVVGGVYTLNDNGGRDLQQGPNQGIYRDDESSYFLELTLVL